MRPSWQVSPSTKLSYPKITLLRAFLLFYRNKPEAVEVTFAGKCLISSLFKRGYNRKEKIDVLVFCLHLCSMCVPDAQGGQKKASALELELQNIMNCQAAAGDWNWSFERIASQFSWTLEAALHSWKEKFWLSSFWVFRGLFLVTTLLTDFGVR